MKNTKTLSYRLDETIERQIDSQTKIEEINVNIEKCGVVLRSHYIVELIDSEMKTNLEKLCIEILQG